MLRLHPILLSLVLLAGTACGGGDGSSQTQTPAPTPAPASPAPTDTPEPTPSFKNAAALIDTREGSVLVRVEVAETDEEKQRGLMFRASLPEDHGMVFLWFEEHSGGFWMKNTLIPLSIAFFDADGKIVSILNMEPCLEDPCEIYDPGVSYHGALEVNRGMFEEWGVEEGDRITLSF